jgi:hypothetical protein
MKNWCNRDDIQKMQSHYPPPMMSNSRNKPPEKVNLHSCLFGKFRNIREQKVIEVPKNSIMKHLISILVSCHDISTGVVKSLDNVFMTFNGSNMDCSLTFDGFINLNANKSVRINYYFSP